MLNKIKSPEFRNKKEVEEWWQQRWGYFNLLMVLEIILGWTVIFFIHAHYLNAFMGALTLAYLALINFLFLIGGTAIKTLWKIWGRFDSLPMISTLILVLLVYFVSFLNLVLFVLLALD